MSASTTDLLVAVLAGGAATRMGTDKALVPLAGRPMAAWVVDAAATVGDVVVIGRREGIGGAAAVPDDLPELGGPASGLATALRIAAGRPVLVLAVDQPWVRPGTLRRLAERYDGRRTVVPVDGGHPQTTCAVYPPGLAGAARTAAADGRSIRSLLDAPALVTIAEWSAWGEDGRSWWSVDTMSDLAEGIERYGPPPLAPHRSASAP